MIEAIEDTQPRTLALYDDIIDVRSPGEFAEDRLPGAINLPVLSNAERAEVGTLYTQVSRFEARRIGAAFVAANIARHLQTTLAEKPAQYRPLVYCWRGGMRSNAMATILSQVGWRVGLLKGGYKTWRRDVVAGLRESDAPLSLLLIDGQTGSAKSNILNRLSELGAQVIDLEGLAAHRGSVFGGFSTRPQPSQKLFESGLWTALSHLDRARPILVEAESNRIGSCEIPRDLWRAMLAAPRIVIRAEPAARARYLMTAYADLMSEPESILRSLARIASLHPKELMEEWAALAGARRYEELAAALMREHYDPLYDRTRRKRDDKPLAEIRLEGFDDAALNAAAEQIAALARRSYENA